MKFSKKKGFAALAGVIAIMLIVGSWAYFTSTSSIDNELHTNQYGSKTVEEFTPKQAMEPGAEITKTVGVTNTGDYDLVVRIMLDEKWLREDIEFKEIAGTGSIDTVDADTLEANQVDPADGLVPATDDEETVVYKKLDTIKWLKGSDGYFYYVDKLEAGQSTSNFMESILLAVNTDIGVYDTAIYYSVALKADMEALIADITSTEAEIEAAYGWTTTKPDDDSTITYIKSETALEDGKEGYANAEYTLTITTEVCQATLEAVDSEWGMTETDLVEIKTDWNLASN